MSVAELEARVAELEAAVAERDRRIADLEREVPLGLGGRKTKRLELPVRKMQQPDGAEGSDLEWPAYKVRQTFLSYFEEKCGHTFWRASPVVPHNDPTLLFVNAGMNQFKPLFLGQADPNTKMSKLTRACNTQKCIRAGGKHNDLEDVGKDVYHHTYFEMLGNWSFGDYFKAEAIEWSWDLLTNVYGLDPERLYITYFEGNEDVPCDNEARELWLKHVPAGRVLPFDAKDNFWEMGDVGPCGPCSEIHYDKIGGRDAASLVNMDDPNVVEIWNLVFMQFNRKPGGKLERLPACHVDTGMGFERITSALQGTFSNYDTDVFKPLIRAIENMTSMRPYEGKVGAEDEDNIDMAYRVLADHIRTLSFAIADGAFPGSEGRGYVLRRILRRAVRYAQEVLKMEPGSFPKLVTPLVRQLKDTFPELAEKESTIYEVLLDEEQTFSRTLKKGIVRFEKEVAKIKKAGGTEIPSKTTFFLYATMGFPIDLTELMAEEVGLKVDVKAFEERMAEHQEASKATKAGLAEGTIRKLEAKETSYLEDNGVVATDNGSVYTWHQDLSGVTVKAIFDGENFVDQIALGDGKVYGVVLDKSNFYYESGGQLADTGAIVLESGPKLRFNVADCQSAKGFIVHTGALEFDEDDEDGEGTNAVTTLKLGDSVTLKVDYERRSDLAKNHTCTHLLNYALRKVVSKDVDQKGSIVTAEKLRFDFNNPSAVPLDKLIEVEKLVREQINASHKVSTKVVPLADAMRIASLRAVFGETYPDPVRVVTCGPEVDEVVSDPLNEKWAAYSVELCGGTHLTRTSEARTFSLVEETAVGKGIRRVTCVTGNAASKAASDAESLRARIEACAGLSGAELSKEQKEISSDLDRATISVSEKHELKQACKTLLLRVQELAKKELALAMEGAMGAVQTALAEGKQSLVYRIPQDGSVAPKIGSDIVKKTKKTPIALFLCQCSPDTDTVLFFATVPKPLQGKLSAKEWVENAGQSCGVKGGGSPAMFNGKGAGVQNIDACLSAAQDLAAKLSE